jgi:hypothetical protein
MMHGASRRWGLGVVVSVALGVCAAAAPPPRPIADLDLAKAFATTSAWRLTVLQGSPGADPYYPEEQVPGAVRLCLKKAGSGPCDPAVRSMARPPPDMAPDAWEPHYLGVARVVRPRGPAAAPLLLLQTLSLHSGDGDQAIYTQLLAYRQGEDRFVPIYAHMTGRNNNQDTRFMASGPLTGSVISAEPTNDAPFGFWITVHRLTPDYRYAQVLRYRSATRYADGNPLGVIDSEMPNIQQRLGIWKPGQPLPLPAGRCPKPRLVKMELWCG